MGADVALPSRSLPGTSALTAPFDVVGSPNVPRAVVVVHVMPPAYAPFAAVVVLVASLAGAPFAVVVVLVASSAFLLPFARVHVALLPDPLDGPSPVS